MLKRTPFHDFHVASGARMVDFAGWEMPILYRGIVEEHEHTRSSGSLFDVSHMGGQSRYSLVCNEAGGVLDDVIVSRDQKNWLVVCNGSNRERIFKHFGDVRRA